MPRTILHLLRLFCVPLLLLSANVLAAWSYSESDGTITDGNWVLAVSTEKNGGKSLQKVRSGSGALDLSTVSDDTGLVLTAVGANAFNGYGGLASIVLPDSVTTIGGSAFERCSNLTSVGLPVNLEEINWSAFGSNPSLERVTPFLPPTIRVLGLQVFKNCPKLSGVLDLARAEIQTIGDGVFSGSGIVEADLSGLERLPASLFIGCKDLTTVTLSPKLLSIGQTSFSGCTSLEKVSPFLPDSLEAIGRGAFTGCPKLALPLVAKGLEELPAEAFKGAGITGADLPAAKTLGPSVFYLCSGLGYARLPALERIVGWGAFSGCGSLTNITPFFADSLVEVGDSTFDGCNRLRGDLVLSHPAMTNLPGFTFRNTKITSASLSHSRHLGANLFSGCKELASVRIGPHTESIGDGVFNSCSSLTNVTPFLPDTLSTLAASTFTGCTKLTGDLFLRNQGITNLSANSFKGTKITSGYFPYLETLGASCFEQCTSLGSVYLPRIVRIDGWGSFWQCQSLTNVIPFFADSLNYVGLQAFNGCPRLTGDLVLRSPGLTNLFTQTFCSTRIRSIDLPFIRTLGDNVFQNCRELTSVRLSCGTESLGDGVFSACTALTNVTPFLPDSMTYLGKAAFARCNRLKGDLVLRAKSFTNLLTQSFQMTSVESADLPYVHLVGQSAFEGASSLRTVTLGREGLRLSGWGPFFGTAKPTDFYFPGEAIVPGNDSQAFYNGGTRNRLHGSLRMDPEGWALVSEELTDADRAAKDFPGPKTFGVYLSGGTRHWLIDWRSPYEPKGTILFLR